MPNWKRVITSGSNGELNTLKLSGVSNAGTDTDKFLVLDSAGNVDFRTGTQIFSDIGASTVSSSLASRITSNDSDISSNTTAISTLNGKTLVSGSSQITISSTTGYTSFSSSIAEDIAGLNGAGYVDGTGANEYIAKFTDSNTLTGSRELRINTSNYLAINGHSGAWNLATYAPVAPLTVRNGTDQGSGQPDHGISYFQVPNGRAGYLQFANGTYSTFTGMDTNGDYYIGFGNATDRTFRFVNNGAGGAPSLSLGTLTISGSGTLKNIGPAQFSGSVSITTANQVAATSDTDKFVVIDGQQLKYRTGAQVLSDIGGQASSNAVTTNTTQTISGAKTFSSDTTFSGNVTVGGTITAQEFHSEYVSSSIVFSSGSTKFGDSSDDNHDFTGSLNVNGGVTIWNLNDPQLTFAGQGLSSNFSMGIDDSDSDKFKISRSSTLGTNDVYKYNYNGGNQNHTFSGDVVLTNSNVGLTGGQLVKINSSGFLVPAVANTDYVPTGSTPDIYVISPVQTYIDFKGLSQGGLPFGGIADPQPIDRAFGVWIAPAAGYIEKIYVSPENANTSPDNFEIQPYKNGSTLSSAVTELLSSAGTNVEYTFGTGASGYDFSANDRISLYLDKNTNTSDLYAIQVVFRVNNQ